MNLFNKYLLLVTFETDDNYSIRFEMKKHYSHSTTRVVTCWLQSAAWIRWHAAVSWQAAGASGHSEL